MKLEDSASSVGELSGEDWSDLLHVTRAAFKEHKDNGLEMHACDISLEQLKTFLEGCSVFLVRDAGRIVAFYSARLGAIDGGVYCQAHLAAVLPEYKGKGLGRRLFRALEAFALRSGCQFLQTNTGCGAKSALAFHHSCGFEDWSYVSWSDTNYYSIVLRKLLPDGRKIPKLARYTSLIRSYLLSHLLFDKYGKDRLVCRCARIPYRFIKKIVKSFS